MSRKPKQPTEPFRPNPKGYPDDTAYLMSSPKNAERLNRAIERLRAYEEKQQEVERERRRKLIARLHVFRGMMPADFKFNREEANER